MTTPDGKAFQELSKLQETIIEHFGYLTMVKYIL